jgi:hypothetical protein
VTVDRDEIRDLLEELSERLAAREMRAELFLVGGAAMALAYATRRSTADLDVVRAKGGAVSNCRRHRERA